MTRPVRQDQRRTAHPWEALLFEDVLDLGAGECLCCHQVVERLDGEGLAVGDLAGRLTTGRVGKGEVGTNTARVHECDLGTRRLGVGQLRVGDDVT
jgi:hypothetical protein